MYIVEFYDIYVFFENSKFVLSTNHLDPIVLMFAFWLDTNLYKHRLLDYVS